MYRRCVSENPCLSGCRLVSFDNSEENLPISSRYNSFIDTLSADTSSWIVFCHEDWRATEDICNIVCRLNPSFIYGPVGIYLQRRRRSDYLIRKGAVCQCAKDGSGMQRIRFSVRSGRVDTLDCQCIIVHSDLLVSNGLRFDENLHFDMYAEDFCVSAYLNKNVITKVADIPCIHYSKGTISSGFRSSLEYVRAKYEGSAKRFATIVGYNTAFGGDSSRPVHLTRFPILSSLF